MLFEGCVFYFDKSSISAVKVDLLKKKVTKYGGVVVEKADSSTIVVCDKKTLSSSPIVVKSSWISESIVKNELLPFEQESFIALEEPSIVSPRKRERAEEQITKPLAISNTGQKRVKISSFSCSSTAPINHNSIITEKLEILKESYAAIGDKWRVLGYQKAISALKKHHKQVESGKEAEEIRGIGKQLADKIEEIITTGNLRKIEQEPSDVKVLKLFGGIFGAGPATAKEWFAQGYRSLKDLESNSTLTRQQRIGLQYYNDINERMPREEASWIVDQVKRFALELEGDLIIEAAGSFRRGKETCGDVDILITHHDNNKLDNLIARLVDVLKKQCVILEELVETQGHKFMGICKGFDGKGRRLDLLVVPIDEFPTAILYFTGSDAFNRSMRLLAHKKGMSLNEHGLYTNVVRHGREKVADGIRLKVSCEQDVFNYLGLEYRSPAERSI